MISGMGIASLQHDREPAVGVDPVHGLAGRKIEYVRAAAETIEARRRAGVGILEAPPTREPEHGGAALDELDDVFGIPGGIVAYPALRTAMFGLDRQQEAIR